MEVVASLSQGRTAAAQCGLFTHKSVPVIFEPPCTLWSEYVCVTKEGKAIPLQTWTGLEGSKRLRLPDFKTVGT